MASAEDLVAELERRRAGDRPAPPRDHCTLVAEVELHLPAGAGLDTGVIPDEEDWPRVAAPGWAPKGLVSPNDPYSNPERPPQQPPPEPPQRAGNRSLGPGRRSKPGSSPAVAGTKRCWACRRYLPVLYFAAHRGTADGLRHICRPCHNERYNGPQ